MQDGPLASPYSLCVYAPVQSDLLSINLRKPLKSADKFEDWHQFDTPFTDVDIAKADLIMPHTGAAYMRNLRAAGRQTRGWHFSEDPATRYLTAILPHWTHDQTRLLLGLNILRQVFPTSGDGQPGYILVHRFDGARSWTLGAVLMRHGASRAVGPEDPVVSQVVAHAKPLATRVKTMSKWPKPHIVDELDLLVGATVSA